MVNFEGKSENFIPRQRNVAKHACELPQTSNSHLPRLPPNAKFLARLKRAFQKLILVSESHPFTRFLLRSRAAVAFEKKRHGRSVNWWIIHPCSNFRLTWEFFMTVTYVYLFITIPYVVAFYRISSKESVEKLNILHPGYAICILDIFMNFITGFNSKDGNDINLDPLLIFRHYSRGYFLVDLLTSVPYTWFTSGSVTIPGPDGNFPKVLAESLPLLKIIRLYTLRQYMKKLSAVFGLSRVSDIGIWLCMFTSLLFHWSACATYAFPFFILHATRTTIKDSDSYVVKSGLYEESPFRIYLVSLHMGVSNLVGSSFIELKKISDADKTIRCLLLLFGTGYMIYLIVITLQLVESLAKPELKYQEIMHEIKAYIRDKRLPVRLKQRLIDYYEYRYQGNYFKENVIFHTVSPHLRQEINVRLSHGLLETATIFRNLPRSLLTSIMGALKPVIYLEEDVVYKCDMDGDCMYFIASGTVAMINYLGKEICHLQDGNYFGEIILIHQERRRNVTVIAVEVCELLRLDRTDFKRLVVPETELYNRLLNIANERIEQTRKINKISEAEKSKRRRTDPRFSKFFPHPERDHDYVPSNDSDENRTISSPKHGRTKRYIRD